MTELRDRFNRGGFWDRAQRGELRLDIVSDNHPSPPLADEPFCTYSQLIEYYTLTGTKVAVVHQYLRPDGTIGASGVPDPKMVLDRGVVYMAASPTSPPERQP